MVPELRIQADSLADADRAVVARAERLERALRDRVGELTTLHRISAGCDIMICFVSDRVRYGDVDETTELTTQIVKAMPESFRDRAEFLTRVAESVAAVAEPIRRRNDVAVVAAAPLAEEHNLIPER